MQKNLDELIYYDPKKFHEAEMKKLSFEYGVEQTKLAKKNVLEKIYQKSLL